MDPDITTILVQWKTGDETALDRLTPLVNDELLRMAKLRIGGESRDVTMQPTALVREAYLKLVDHTRLPWQNRAHFYAIAATIMRRILIDDARKRNAEKRGGGLKVTLHDEMDAADEKPADVMALDLALQSLAEIDERKSRIIELKYFGGMTTEEISEVMGIPVATRDGGTAGNPGQQQHTGQRGPCVGLSRQRGSPEPVESGSGSGLVPKIAGDYARTPGGTAELGR